MHHVVQAFFSRLHTTYLKPRGYKKQRHTFTRVLNGFTERVRFQGSAWNTGDSLWRFYVNFGVLFHDLAPRFPDRDLPDAHCWARIESIVPEAPPEFDLVGDDDPLAIDRARYLELASQRVAQEMSRCADDTRRRVFLSSRSHSLAHNQGLLGTRRYPV